MNLSLFSCQPNYRLSRSVTLVKAVGLLSHWYVMNFVRRNFDYFLNKLILLPCIHKKSSSLKKKTKPALLGFEKLL